MHDLGFVGTSKNTKSTVTKTESVPDGTRAYFSMQGTTFISVKNIEDNIHLKKIYIYIYLIFFLLL